MAKTKAGGSTQWGRDSASKRLGVKLFAGERAKPGNIIVRQRGTKFVAGQGVRRGNDDTLYAYKVGKVAFQSKTKTRFDGTKRKVNIVHIISS